MERMDSAALVGRRLNRYLIGELIGHGGMGLVYRARDTYAHRDVALKVLDPSSNQDALDRFQREALWLSYLRRPSHRAGLRHRAGGRDRIHRHGADGDHTAVAHPGRPGAGRRGRVGRRGHPARPRGRASHRHRAPRREAGERGHLDERRHQAARLRRGQSAAVEHPRSELRHEPADAVCRHARLHVARATARRPARRAGRHLQRRRRALRTGDRAAAVFPSIARRASSTRFSTPRRHRRRR